jgi:hypothetical protein
MARESPCTTGNVAAHIPPPALRSAFNSAGKRASASGLPFALAYEDIQRMFEEQKGCGIA